LLPVAASRPCLGLTRADVEQSFAEDGHGRRRQVHTHSQPHHLYGTFVNYRRQALGISDEQIKLIRANLLKG